MRMNEDTLVTVSESAQFDGLVPGKQHPQQYYGKEDQDVEVEDIGDPQGDPQDDAKNARPKPTNRQSAKQSFTCPRLRSASYSYHCP